MIRRITKAKNLEVVIINSVKLHGNLNIKEVINIHAIFKKAGFCVI